MKRVAYELGMKAFMEGMSLEDNPFLGADGGLVQFEAWDNGFLDAGSEFAATHADLEDNEPLRILSDSSWSLR